MNETLRQQILFELNFLLENQEHLSEDLKDWWKEWKGEAGYLGKELGLTAKNLAQGDPSRLKQLGKAVSLGIDDIQTLYEEDPRAFWQSMLDVVSLIDPTGLADYLNSAIYFKHGEKVLGTVSLIAGGLTTVGSVASVAGGAGIPIVILGKTLKTIHIAKDGSKLFTFCEKLAGFFPKILELLKPVTKSVPALKPVEAEAIGFFARLQKSLANKEWFKNFDAAFNYLFGGAKLESEIKVINSAEFAAKAAKAKAITHGISQAGGIGITAVSAAEMGEAIKEREAKEKKVRASKICQNNSCGTIYYDKESKKYVDSTTGKPDPYFNMAVAII